jgi:hypothetical protein
MHLMVYAPYGRAGIYMLQEYCRLLGIQATEDGLRDLVETLGLLPPGHPLKALLAESPDFQYEAGIADTLLHPQDRSYSVSEVFKLLANCGLRFGRWLQQAPYSARCGAIARLPHVSSFAGLPLPEQYAAVELFRGTMTSHSVIAYREEESEGPKISPLRLEGHYIPIRMPETICVEERLPAGSSGVLINRGHTYRDLFLPIDPREKRWFDKIDGRRNIFEIVDGDGPRGREGTFESALEFFETLWLYDQIAFDASKGPA